MHLAWDDNPPKGDYVILSVEELILLYGEYIFFFEKGLFPNSILLNLIIFLSRRVLWMWTLGSPEARKKCSQSGSSVELFDKKNR